MYKWKFITESKTKQNKINQWHHFMNCLYERLRQIQYYTGRKETKTIEYNFDLVHLLASKINI